MADTISEISTLDELRGFVQKTICDRNQLLLPSCRVQEKILLRYGKPCGMYFTVCGPRAVQFSAIWDTDRHTILFYGCDGDRFHRNDLTISTALQAELTSLVGTDEKIAA